MQPVAENLDGKPTFYWTSVGPKVLEWTHGREEEVWKHPSTQRSSTKWSSSTHHGWGCSLHLGIPLWPVRALLPAPPNWATVSRAWSAKWTARSPVCFLKEKVKQMINSDTTYGATLQIFSYFPLILNLRYRKLICLPQFSHSIIYL